MTDPTPGTIALTEEGKGIVATCQRCGWLQWNETKAAGRDAGRGHTCRKEDLRPPGRRYPPKKKRGR